MATLQELQEKLGRGLYINNLYEMAGICRNLALDAHDPAPFFIMRQVFLDIARRWEGKPLVEEEAQQVEESIIYTLENLIEGIMTEVSNEEVYGLMNCVASAHISSFG